MIQRLQPVKTITDEKKSITTIHSSSCTPFITYVHPYLTKKYPPTSLCIAQSVSKKNMFVFSMLPCRYYYTPAIWSRDKKNCIRKIWLMLSKYFFGQTPYYYKLCRILFHDPVTTQRVQNVQQQLSSVSLPPIYTQQYH